MIRVSRVLHSTTAEGPGSRTAVWVQGCTIRCAGCVNPQLFSFDGGTLLEPADIVSGAIAAGDEGLTLLGGEPFDQAAEVGILAEEARRAGLGVITFTGYQYERLREAAGGIASLLSSTDLLVDGPFMSESPEPTRALVGSANQQFVHLTDRYRDYEPSHATNRVDIRVGPNGEIEVAGFLTTDRVDELASMAVARRRFAVRARS